MDSRKLDFKKRNIEVETFDRYKEIVGLKKQFGEGTVQKTNSDGNIEEKEFACKTELKELLKTAQKQKDFEIEMYWKRALYFWGFIVAIYTAFFAVAGTSKNSFFGAENVIIRNCALVLLSLLGFVFCLGFYFQCIGSKQWQENWEKHVEILERIAGGGLFNLFMYDSKKNYSVTRINHLLCIVLSCAAGIVFTFCVVNLAFDIDVIPDCCKWFFGIVAFAVAIVIFFVFKSCKKLRGNPIDYGNKKQSKELQFCFCGDLSQHSVNEEKN